METIEFKNVETKYFENLKNVFDYVAESKRNEKIDEDALSHLFGELFHTKFTHTKEESDYWLKKWRANNSIECPWDYGSWVDSIMEAEVELDSIVILNNGSGKLVFNQLAWPTSGLAALTELIKIFGGMVTSNDAI